MSTKKERLHPFVWSVNGLKDAASMGLHEYDDGLEAHLYAGKFRQLPGGVAPFELWESAETATRFTVVARYPSITIVVQVQDVQALGAFMTRYIPFAAVLPEVVLPEKPHAPHENYVTFRR